MFKNKYPDVLIITGTTYESDLINKNSNDNVIAKCFGSQIIGFRAKNVIFAYNGKTLRRLRGNDYVDDYEEYVRKLYRIEEDE